MGTRRGAVGGVAMNTLWQARPTLVTGGTGLLGGWLVRRLLDLGADVVCLVRDQVPQSAIVTSGLIHRVKVVRGDVREQALMERVLGEYEVDTVFHLAAQTIVGIANRNPVSTFETNVRGTWALLEACRRSPLVKRVVFASSDKAYGAHDTLPYNEDTPLRGRHPYDVSKSCADLIAQAYAASYGLPVVITRCGNFYGGGDLNWNRIVPGTIRSALRGQRPVVRSDGTLVRDYLYVEDGVSAYLTLAEALGDGRARPGAAFNFGHRKQIPVLELVRQILALCGREGLEPDVRGEATNEIPYQVLDPTRANRELGWEPRFPLRLGLERSIDWYRDFLGTATA
jgi:CDP-glucose 4,6-dehydratase